ncbi:short-chain dehydrogenase/reductase SDR [Natrialba asiatica DSM 12278]|uniref:Short-chain dehydrogenase/reductase SDR n=2 Tax=Natrialba asiatica TaxID=64602 RepID=M0B756_NATA1|nr:short-chain dehydrogenase/reductase SDR [Natrialba asiatica DSM 12278]
MLTSLVADGYRVAGLDSSVANLESLQETEPKRVRYYECDVTNPDDVRDAVSGVIETWNRIDILVNNAGISTVAPFGELAMEETRREFEVNFFGYLRMIRAVLPHMRERGDGIIHNMGSGTGDVGHLGLSGYAATKGAIKAFVRSLRLELQHTGVSCTLMVPPTTNTRMVAGLEYPSWMTSEPDAVGRKLASNVESTQPVITPDRKTTLGLLLIERFSPLWRKITDRFVESPD